MKLKVARARKTSTRAWMLIAVAAFAALLGWLAWEIPATHTLLLQSFTRLPPDFVELYFSNLPAVSHGDITVPVILVNHGQSTMLELRTSVLDGSGHVTAQLVTAVSAPQNLPMPLSIRLPAGPHPSQVQVALLGHSQFLQYRIGS